MAKGNEVVLTFDLGKVRRTASNRRGIAQAFPDNNPAVLTRHRVLGRCRRDRRIDCRMFRRDPRGTSQMVATDLADGRSGRSALAIRC